MVIEEAPSQESVPQKHQFFGRSCPNETLFLLVEYEGSEEWFANVYMAWSAFYVKA